MILVASLTSRHMVYYFFLQMRSHNGLFFDQLQHGNLCKYGLIIPLNMYIDVKIECISYIYVVLIQK